MFTLLSLFCLYAVLSQQDIFLEILSLQFLLPFIYHCFLQLIDTMQYVQIVLPLWLAKSPASFEVFSFTSLTCCILHSIVNRIFSLPCVQEFRQQKLKQHVLNNIFCEFGNNWCNYSIDFWNKMSIHFNTFWSFHMESVAMECTTALPDNLMSLLPSKT